MPHDVVMPRLGWTMEVGRVVEWLKGDGEAVEAGDLILAIESDKAVTEVEALDSGILRIPPEPQIGVELPVGALLGYIVEPDEPDPFTVDPAMPPENPEEALSTPSVPVGEPFTGSRAANGVSSNVAQVAITSSNGATAHEPAISPRARRIAEELGVDWRALTGSGSTGRIRESDVRAAATTVMPSLAATRATPEVRRLAAEAGVNLATISPGGPGGRVTRADVLAAARSSSPASDHMAGSEDMTPLRRVIFERMGEAARTVAPVTLTSDADATELVRLRDLLKEEATGSGEAVPAFTDFIARLVAQSLREHPALNASVTGDRIVQHEHVHIGIAVDTERGLLVPVVRDADRKSAHAIALESKRLIEASRSGHAGGDDLRGSTFTITNLGMHDIDAFTPIINLPECAVLGLGRIVSRPVVLDDGETVAVRKMMALSLTFDHRIVDGAPAARFLQAVKRKIERPYTWLMR